MSNPVLRDLRVAELAISPCDLLVVLAWRPTSWASKSEVLGIKIPQVLVLTPLSCELGHFNLLSISWCAHLQNGDKNNNTS